MVRCSLIRAGFALVLVTIPLSVYAQNRQAQSKQSHQLEELPRFIPKQGDFEQQALLDEIDDQIRLLEEELAAHRRQIDRVGPSSPFRYSTAFVWTLEASRLAAIHVETEIRSLRREKLRLQQSYARSRSTSRAAK
jgi:hypothetical protein